MNCKHHIDQAATMTCSECGAGLCNECGSKMSPPMCVDCAQALAQSIKGEILKNFAISIVLMIVGIIAIQSPLGALLAGIPFGWSLLNRITPSMFIWMSVIGWIVYFIIKLVLAYLVGVPALAVKLFKWTLELRKANSFLRCIEEETNAR